MSIFSHNDYISYNWSGRDRRSDQKDIFDINFKRCSQEPKNLKEECYRAARLVYERSTKPIAIMLSGGVDSEITLRSFVEQNIPCTAFIFQYKKQGFFDIHYGINFCKNKNIPLEIISFDEDKFFDQDIWHYIHKYKLWEPYIAFDIKRMEMLNEYCTVWGNGDVLINFDGNNFYSMEEATYNMAWVWQKDNNIESCYRFLKYTPELMYSFINDPKTKYFYEVARKMNFDNSRWWKQWVFKEYWPDMIPRNKFNGFEKIAEQYLQCRKRCRELYDYEHKEKKFFIEDLRKILYV